MRTGRNMDVGRIMRCGVHFVQKSANKREQGQTCLSFAELKQILRKKILQILSNLANLYSGFFSAVSGIEPSTAGADGDVHAPSVDGLRCGRVGAMWKSGAQKTGGLCAESWEKKVGKRKRGM